MAKQNQSSPYGNASSAVAELYLLDGMVENSEVVPGVDVIELKASSWGQKLTETVAMENRTAGWWSVAPHDSDPPHTPEGHSWITLTPKTLANNSLSCKIEVDTSKLMLGQVYERQILCHGDGKEETGSLTMRVETAPKLIGVGKQPYLYPIVLLIVCCAVVGGVSFTWAKAWMDFVMVAMFGAGTVIGALFGMGAMFGALVGTAIVALLIVVAKLILGNAITSSSFWIVAFAGGISVIVAVMGIAIGAFIKVLLRSAIKNYSHRGYHQGYAFWLLLLAAGLGMSLALAPFVGFIQPFVAGSLAGTVLALAVMFLYPQFNQRRLIAKYRQVEKDLIKS